MGYSPDDLANMIAEQSKSQGVDPNLALAVAQNESSMNPNAFNGSGGGTGAAGLFQLRGPAAQEMGVTNRLDPVQNIQGGVGYLAKKLAVNNGNVALALAAYNQGQGTVDKNGITPQAQQYINSVLSKMGNSPVQNSPQNNDFLNSVDSFFGRTSQSNGQQQNPQDFLNSVNSFFSESLPETPKSDSSFMGTVKDIGNVIPAEAKRLGMSLEDLTMALGGKLGIVNDETALNTIKGNLEAKNSPNNYQATTTGGEIAQGLMNMAPAIALSFIPGVGEVLGPAAFAAQGTWQAGTSAIDQGNSLTNAQIKAVGAGVLNSMVGSAMIGSGNKVLSGIPVIGKAFEPVAADTLSAVTKRSLQGAATMAMFKPLSTGVEQIADIATGENPNGEYDYKPNLSDLMIGALMVVPHSATEYFSRNSLPATPTMFADGTVGMAHKNGTLFSSQDAAKSFIDENNLTGTEITPLSNNGKLLGYAVKINDNATSVNPDNQQTSAIQEAEQDQTNQNSLRPISRDDLQNQVNSRIDELSANPNTTPQENAELNMLVDNRDNLEHIANVSGLRIRSPEELLNNQIIPAPTESSQIPDTNELNDFIKSEQIDLSYRRMDAFNEARKLLDYSKIEQQLRNQNNETTANQANALSRAQGFDDEQPTAMDLAFQRAKNALNNQVAEHTDLFEHALAPESSIDDAISDTKAIIDAPIITGTNDAVNLINKQNSVEIQDKNAEIQAVRDKLNLLKSQRSDNISGIAENRNILRNDGSEVNETSEQSSGTPLPGGLRDTTSGAVTPEFIPTPVTFEQAQHVANQFTRQGSPSYAVPHPTVEGKYYVSDKQDNKQAENQVPEQTYGLLSNVKDNKQSTLQMEPISPGSELKELADVGEHGAVENNIGYFGEKIEGARKDIAEKTKKEYGNDDIDRLPLSKIGQSDLSYRQQENVETISQSLRDNPITSKYSDILLKRGEEGKKGGIVIADDIESLPGLFEEKTGRVLGDDVLRSVEREDASGDVNKSPEVRYRKDGVVQGLFDQHSGLTFMVASHLTPYTAPAVMAHEILHGTDTDGLRQQATKLIDMRDSPLVQAKTRKFLQSVSARMESSGVSGDEMESASYIVEQAMLIGRQDGFSSIDGKLWGHLANKLGNTIADFVRNWIAKVRAALFNRGVSINLTVDDMIELARSGMAKAARGEVNSGEETMLRSDQAERFYSQLRRVMQNAPDKIFNTGAQVKLWLQANSGKNEIKRDEIYFSGINDYLDITGKISKSVVMDYLDNNGVRVETKVLDESRTTKYGGGNLVLPGGTNYREMVLISPQAEKWGASDTTHFGDTGGGKAIGWTRYDTRNDSDGNSGTFIQEIQSKRGMEGRSYGFASNPHVVEKETATGTIYQVVANGKVFSEEPTREAAEFTISNPLNRLHGVPPAPFLSDANNKSTNAYIALLLKKQISQAIDDGRKFVAWTTGDQQAERYDLSKKIDMVTAKRELDGTYNINANPFGNIDSNRMFRQGGVHVNDLENIVGKELAEKIINDSKENSDWHNYSGLDLKIGGKWTSAMYGDENGLNTEGKPSLITQSANEILRKMGGGEVEGISLDSGKQPGFYITPEMRRKILSEGMPLFSKSPLNEEDKPEGIKFGGYSPYLTVKQNEYKKQGIGDAFYKALSPASRGENAITMSGIMRNNLGEQARERESALHDTLEYAKQFDKNPVQENYEFIKAMQFRDSDDPVASAKAKAFIDKSGFGEAAEALRSILDERREQVRALGKGKLEEFDKSYFPQMWMPRDKAKAASIFSRRPLTGSAGFIKSRVHDYFQDGLDSGLEPITTNPVEMALLKAREMDRFIYGQKIFQEMKDNGIAKFVRFGTPAPDGFVKLNDKVARVLQHTDSGMVMRGDYYAPEQVATIFNNHLSPGLRGNGFYDAWRSVGMALNTAQLGLSAFHLGFTTFDAMTSKSALGFKQIFRGELTKGTGNLLQAFNPAQPFLNAYKGDKLLKAYLGDITDPSIAPIVESLIQGGGRIDMDEFYRSATINSFKDAVRKGNYSSALIKALPTFMDWISKPIFQYLVPRQKLGVFFDMAKDALEKNPNMSLAEKRTVMGKLWDSVDNRMGQMVYDNLFWDRLLKDALMASVRSVGWNLGTFREIGGGIADIKDIVKDGKWQGLSDRSAYVFGLVFMSAIMGSIVNYLYTGQSPQDMKDLFFPRTGKTRPDGSMDRVSFASYMKDIYEYGHDISGFVKYGSDPTHTLKNKMHPLIGMVSQILENKDFFGGSIRSPGDTPIQQILDESSYLLKQFTPFGLRNYIQQSALKGVEPSVLGYVSSPPFIGITPSPGYITKSDEQQESEMVSRMKPGLIRKFRTALKNGEDRGDVVDRMKNSGLQHNDIMFVLKTSGETQRQSREKHFGE